MTKPRLLQAQVWHLRERPKRNEFTYSVFYVACPVVPAPKTKPSLLSFDRFNMLSLYKRDIGPKDGSGWLAWIHDEYKKAGVEVAQDDTIEVATHPRLFGYAFNPITFWMLTSGTGVLKAVLCEVHNTFGDDHNYVLSHDDGSAILPDDAFRAEKKLYVSPYNTMDGYYTFSFKKTADVFHADITYSVGESVVLKTAMHGAYEKLTSLTILGVLVRYPLMTFMVIVRIHWQAIKLYVKGMKHTLKDRPKETHGDTTKGTSYE